MANEFHPFKDMAESTKQQHEVDKAQFNARKAESAATWEEAKLSPKARQALMQEQREEKIAEANKEREAAEARVAHAKELNASYSKK